MAVYTLMGQPAEEAFTQSWGVSYGMGQVSEWQDILNEAIKGIFILIILDQLRLVPAGKWLERHLDILSIQAHLMKHTVVDHAPAGVAQRLWAYTCGGAPDACAVQPRAGRRCF